MLLCRPSSLRLGLHSPFISLRRLQLVQQCCVRRKLGCHVSLCFCQLLPGCRQRLGKFVGIQTLLDLQQNSGNYLMPCCW